MTRISHDEGTLSISSIAAKHWISATGEVIGRETDKMFVVCVSGYIRDTNRDTSLIPDRILSIRRIVGASE